MCGIAGSINSNFSYDRVISSLRHRGPDEQRSYESGNVRFLHLRLSILDIAGGGQPMHLNDNYTIVFNGEIYNHKELRKQFNLSTNTSSDTEILLLLYVRFGPDFLHHLDGMFAFVIHDKLKNELFIARDRAGKKPFYYYSDKNQFSFASELNALGNMLSLEVDDSAIFHYLRLGSFYRQYTPYKNVHELKAGTWMRVNCNSLVIKETNWWNVHEFYERNSNDSFEEAVQKTDEFLHLAIKRRLETSDLEVGSFLSGGIDSGLVTAIASRYHKNLKTFTVSFDGEYDEAPLAKQVAQKYGTKHTEIKISFENLKNDLETILGNYGEPFFDSSAIPSYYVSKESKKHVTVVLNGDGADELFGGYRRYVPFAQYDFFRKNILVKTPASIFKTLAPASNNKKSLYNYIYRLASLASKTDLGIYLSAGVDIFEDYENNIIDPGFNYLEDIEEDFRKIAHSNLSGLKKIMNLDFDTNLFSDLLVKMDIATMANSQEGRSAFMSKEFLEYIPTLPDNYKIKGKTTKYLLRQLSKKYLPADIIYQPKRGFEIPLKHWINNELKDPVFDYLSAPNAFYKKFVTQEFVHKLLRDRINIPGEKRAKILWTLLSLEIWYKRHNQ